MSGFFSTHTYIDLDLIQTYKRQMVCKFSQDIVTYLYELVEQNIEMDHMLGWNHEKYTIFSNYSLDLEELSIKMNVHDVNFPLHN